MLDKSPYRDFHDPVAEIGIRGFFNEGYRLGLSQRSAAANVPWTRIPQRRPILLDSDDFVP